MISAQLQGGLGNQLFQIAATLALANRHQDLAGFDFSRHIQLGQGNAAQTYRSSLFGQLVQLDWSPPKYQFYEQGSGRYTPIPYRPGILLHGFFHGWEFFQDYQSQIKQTFKLSLSKQVELRQKYGITDRDACGLHLRRGDYLTNGACFALLSDCYYQTAVSLLSPATVIVVCSDDLDYCRQLFQGDRYRFSTETSDLEDFLLLSACDRQIISNSTFSWWASYLSATNIPAIAPRQWQQNQQDLIAIQRSPHLQLI